MPTYEYQCTSEDCQHRFELFQQITARTTRKCPACGNKAKRLIGTGAGIIFRGSGFYATDYRTSEYKEKAKADKNALDSTGSDGKNDSGKESSSKVESKSG